jgi:hypothetical protein
MGCFGKECFFLLPNSSEFFAKRNLSSVMRFARPLALNSDLSLELSYFVATVVGAATDAGEGMLFS